MPLSARTAASQDVRRTAVPIDDVPKRGDVIGTTVLVVQVVSVLPNVQSENRRAADARDRLSHQRAVLIGGAADFQLAAVDDQPSPAAAEASRAALANCSFIASKLAECLVDRGGQIARRLAPFAGPITVQNSEWLA